MGRKPANVLVKLNNARDRAVRQRLNRTSILGKIVVSHILTKTHQVTYRNSIEADIAGELAVDSETEPEKLMQVNRALGWGQITCSWQQERPLFGEDFILCPLVELARKWGGPWQHAFHDRSRQQKA